LNLAIGVIAFLLAIFAIFHYRAIVAVYWRKTGYASHIAALSTLAVVGVLSGVMALAWGLSALCVGAGIWRNALAVLFYSVLMAVLGRPVIAVSTRLVTRWYYM
jgi:hypothetical protein